MGKGATTTRFLFHLTVITSIILSSLVFLFTYIYFDAKRIDEVCTTPYSVNFYLKETTVTPQKALDFFKQLSSKNQISIVKTTEEYVGESSILIKSGVFYEPTFPVSQLRITKGEFPIGAGTLLASYETEQASQVGTIYSFAKSRKLILQTLEDYYDARARVDGSYTLVSAVLYNHTDIIDAISEYFHIDAELLLHQTVFKQTSAHTLLYVFLGSFVVVLLLFILLIASIPISRMKENGIKHLLGYSDMAIWLALVRGFVATALVTAIVLDAILLILLSNNDLTFMLWLFGVQLLTLLLLVVVSSVVLLALFGQKPGAVLKNSVSMKGSRVFAIALKAAIVVGIAVAVAPVSETALWTIAEYQSQEQWVQYGEYSVMASNQLAGDDLDSIASGDTRLEEKYGSLYDDLNDKLGGIYIKSQDYLHPTDDPLESSYQKLTVNPNYLLAFPILDVNGNQITVAETEKAHILLVPASRKDDADRLLAIHKDTIKDTIESAKRRQGDYSNSEMLSPDNLSVRVVLYVADKPFFSYDDQVGESTGFMLKDPLIYVATKSNMLLFDRWSLIATGLRAPLKLDLTDPLAAETLASIIEDHGLAENHVKFDTLKNLKIKEINNVRNSLLLFIGIVAIIFAIGLLSSFYLFCIIVLSKRRWLLVARYLGYSQLALYKIEILIFLVLYILATIVVIALAGSVTGVLIIAIVAALDLLISFAIARHLDNKNLTVQLKGA